MSNKLFTVINNVLKKQELADSTIKLYSDNILRLYMGLGIKSNTLDPLLDYKLIGDYIIKNFNSESSKRNYFNTVFKLIKNNRKFSNTIKDYYDDKRRDATQAFNDARLDNTVKASETISFDELIHSPNIIEDAINKQFGDLFLNEKQYSKLDLKDKKKYNRLLSDYIIMYIHSNRIPQRLDLFNLRIIYDKDIPTNINFLFVNKYKIELHLIHYKTSKTYGPQIIQFSKENRIILRKFIRTFKMITGGEPNFLLYKVDKDGSFNLFNSIASFSKYLTNLFKKYIGVPIGINQIRQIYETNFFNNPNYKNLSNREREEFSNQLLHAHSTALQSYNKIID